jgi:putative hemolysin
MYIPHIHSITLSPQSHFREKPMQLHNASSATNAASAFPITAFFARPYLLPLAGFRAKVPLFIDRGDFIIKTADNEEELDQALRLRPEVFIGELLGRRGIFGVDMDRFDGKCDHLIAKEKTTGRCLGTYRLISDLYCDGFYSATEFSLGRVAGLDGIKLEIGRVCIAREHRGNNMMGLLWEGIYRYMQLIRARYVFGCSSIMTTDRVDIAIAHRYLTDRGYLTSALDVAPRKKYRLTTLHADMSALSSPDDMPGRAQRIVPRLLEDYFQFGARVCGEPALDRAFRCADYFTILDLHNLNESSRDERLR